MDYIFQLPIRCSKGNLKCVLKCTKYPNQKGNGYMYTLMSDLTPLLFLFITNYPIRKNICQVINYH